jgi:ribosomal protein S4E
VTTLSLNFRIFFESENFQNLKMIESKKISTKLLKVKNIPKPKSENFQGSLRRLQKSK